MKHILGNEGKEEEQPREYDKANHLRAARCMTSLGKMRKHPTVACIQHTTRYDRRRNKQLKWGSIKRHKCMNRRTRLFVNKWLGVFGVSD